MYSLKDKLVLITGASSGIGAACARQFAALGAKLILVARRIEKLETLAKELKDLHNTAVHLIELDIKDKSAVFEKLSSLPEPWQNIDVLINNAGLASGLDSFQEASLEDWELMLDTNIKGLLYVTKAILPNMLLRNVGHIVNLGSIAGHQVYPKGNVYCASKAAVNSLTQGLKLDLSGTAIRVSTIDPGLVETDFSAVRFKGDEVKAKAVYQGLQALKPEDIADVIAFCVTRPAHVNILEMILMPTAQSSATVVHRE